MRPAPFRRRPAVGWLAVGLLLPLAVPSGCTSAPPDRVVSCDGQAYPSAAATPYVLPFPEGAAYAMPLGNCSRSFHAAETPDRYAYDFAMPIGTPVTASRAGRVVRVVESGADYAFPNNLIVVVHGDGTFAQYMHLTQGGADVSVGALVEPGDVLGRSGATGLAGYPHLHFVVTRDDWAWPYQPVPVSFRNASPLDVPLRDGTTYRAR